MRLFNYIGIAHFLA